MPYVFLRTNGSHPLPADREHRPVGFKPRVEGMSELAHQIRNYSNFTWLNGSFILDWLIHNLDVCCWVKDAWPVSAQGQGGRQVRTEPDQLFDHYAAESGREVTWDEAMASELVLAPGLDDFTMDSDPPVVPDAEGRYPIAMPGVTEVL